MEWKRVDYECRTNDYKYILTIGNFEATLYEKPRTDVTYYSLGYVSSFNSKGDYRPNRIEHPYSTLHLTGIPTCINDLNGAKQWAEGLLLENLIRHISDLSAVVDELNKNKGGM